MIRPHSAYDAALILQAAKLARKGLTNPPPVKAQRVAIAYAQPYVR